jgi:hypothetical protein
MKRVVCLLIAALVAMMILVPSALAQGMTTAGPLPPSGGAPVGEIVLPAAALLIGSGVLAFAVLRRSR